MRKIAVFLCVIITLLSFSACQKDYTHGVYEVTITSTEIFNNHVGNNWYERYSCDGKPFVNGEKWTVPLGTAQTLTIDVTVTENDVWPDVGYSSLSVDLKEAFKTSTIVTVTENKGRYKGNCAQWEINCTVKLVKKIEK